MIKLFFPKRRIFLPLKYSFLMLLLVSFFYSCEQDITVEREEAHWEYEHPDWQQIGFASCGGNAQSPIDINTLTTVKSDDLPSLSFDYTPFLMKIVDNGHTIQVIPGSGENTLIYNGVRYRFVQFHFHHISEHQINGQHTNMELHLVHSDDTGNLLVLTFMINQGEENVFLTKVFNEIPEQKRTEITTEVQLDINEILPEDLSYYTYYGSLTTPPCSASVQFVVLKSHMKASNAQINRFSAVYFANNRIIQALNNRLVFEKIN